jgi:hypothetical protein
MTKFEIDSHRETIQRNGVTLDITRYKKIGTSRIFFAVTYKNKKLGKTLFARRYDAENYLIALTSPENLDKLQSVIKKVDAQLTE